MRKKPMIYYLFQILLCTALGCILGGCGTLLSKESSVSSTPKAGVFTANDNTISTVLQNQSTVVVYKSKTEIEALSGAGSWLVWNEDGSKRLKLANISELNENRLDGTLLPAISHDVDLICMAPAEYVTDKEENFDLYVHDGDSFFYHYWFRPSTAELKLVRRLATNPDIESCVLFSEELVFSDPYLGALSLSRNPETDNITTFAKEEQITELESFELLSTKPTQVDTPLHLNAEKLSAKLETMPVIDGGDAADDPVVLVNKNVTWISGTNKKRGLAIYDLDGKQIHFSARGRINNVDAEELGDGKFLLAGSNRTHKSIDLFFADLLNNLFEYRYSIPLALDDPYGLCLGKTNDGVAVFIGDSEGLVEHWLLNKSLNKGKRVASYAFDSQTEGCVFDRTANTLYIGQEDLGIWRINPVTQTRELIERITQGHLVADVEGMDIYYGSDARYMIASSQGDDSYVLFNVEPWEMLGKFRIAANIHRNIDGVSETDGLAVSAGASKNFPKGLLVVQDGRNRAPVENQNFKVIDWRDVAALIEKFKSQ